MDALPNSGFIVNPNPSAPPDNAFGQGFATGSFKYEFSSHGGNLIWFWTVCEGALPCPPRYSPPPPYYANDVSTYEAPLEPARMASPAPMSISEEIDGPMSPDDVLKAILEGYDGGCCFDKETVQNFRVEKITPKHSFQYILETSIEARTVRMKEEHCKVFIFCILKGFFKSQLMH